MASASANTSPLVSGGTGKAARAKAAKRGHAVVTDLTHHRACGGEPVASDLFASSKYARVVEILEQLEAMERMKHKPQLVKRRSVPMDNHGSMITSTTICSDGKQERAHENSKIEDGLCDMSERNMRGQLVIERILEFALSTSALSSITHLNLSRNELWDLPSTGLEALSNLRHLNLSRNWFSSLPRSVVELDQLEVLDVSHNMIRSSLNALLIASGAGSGSGSGNACDMETCALQSLPNLKVLDLRFNQKLGHQKLQSKLCHLLPSVDVKMAISFPPPEGAFVGGSAAERDPSLLRSQLEPWPTTALRRRLVADFGEEPSSVSPDMVSRAEVMGRLLDLYEEENNGAHRTVVRVDGTSVDGTILRDLRMALSEWSDSWTNGNQERVSIDADHYMILTSPASWSELGHKKRAKAAAKLEKHRDVWELAQAAMKSVDADFASRYTALAVTHNFRGSPHIDKQNLAPFYGLSVGDFKDETGGVMVECSARVVAHVNTKDRLGKVDGRYPHWVAPYDEDKDRYSLIFYQTMGQPFQQAGPAIFDVPRIDIKAR